MGMSNYSPAGNFDYASRNLYVCKTCNRSYEISRSYHPDPPGHHWSADPGAKSLPCGHEEVPYDTEHETLSIREVR